MIKDNIKLPYGLREGRLYHISKVERGLRCNCVCPGCQIPLVAKKGTDKIHHFAHHREKECIGGLETAIHLMAKQIIYDHNQITTPTFYKKTSLKDNRGKIVVGKEVLLQSEVLKFDKVELELLQDGYRPDVIGFINGKKLFIEIKVTHSVEDDKKRQIESLKHPVIEIDLSKIENETFQDHQIFIKEVLYEKSNRIWINNPKAESIYQAHMSDLQIKTDNINERYEIEENERRRVDSKRKSLREKYSHLLDQIKNSYKADWKNKRNQHFLKENEHEIFKIKKKIELHKEGIRPLFNEDIKYGWLIESHPIVWQGAIYLKFIQSKPIRSLINPHQVINYIYKHFDLINFVQQLINLKNTQKKPRTKYLTNSDKNSIWFLEKKENERLVNPEKPVMNYLVYLSKVGMLKSQDFKTDNFLIKFNSIASLNTHIKELEKERERRRSNRHLYKVNRRIENEIRFNKEKFSKKLRVTDMIKSEQRVLELYGICGSQCTKCMLTSHNKDGVNCPFCGNNNFKQIKITNEHLDVAHHKYQCNSSVTTALKVDIDRTLLKEFDS